MSLNSEKIIVRTVNGDMPAQELGHTQCHEHIFLEKGPSFESNPALLMDDMGRSLRELREFSEAGGKTIVDAQPIYYGRSAKALKELSCMSGINIVSVTGFHKKMFMEKEELFQASEEELAALYTDEIVKGMLNRDSSRSEAKAGIVKAAFEPGGFEDKVYGKMFEAVAETAAQTGVPILVHTEKNTDILKLIEYFERAHIAASRLIICHLDRTHYDVGYHKEVLSTGCFLCYDSVHRLKYVSEEQELELIKAMRDQGFTRQLLLSLDTTNQRLRAYYAKDMGLDYILKTYIPMLLSNTFTKDEIQFMCVLNAQNALSLS